MHTVSFNKLKIKNTHPRTKIAEYLENQQHPVSVQDIENYIDKIGCDINQATIYRILNLFYDKGVVDRLEFEEGKFRYELSKGDHHHLICEVCGKVEDMINCSVESFQEEIVNKIGFIVRKHKLEFFGVCNLCQS